MRLKLESHNQFVYERRDGGRILVAEFHGTNSPALARTYAEMVNWLDGEQIQTFDANKRLRATLDLMESLRIGAEQQSPLELIESLRIGAEQQSQSHADVLAKIRDWEQRKGTTNICHSCGGVSLTWFCGQCVNSFAALEYERKQVAFCQESLTRIRDMAPPHSAIVAHIDVLLAFLRRTI